jgi:8-oxo-dGTP diphosphatase
MPYAPIVATLGYVLSPDKRSVLMIHRNTRQDDHAYGKFNGLGGKVEASEDVVSCMKREIKEEADIEVVSLMLRGTINWPGFGKQGEDWLGFIFIIDEWRGTPRTHNPEGELSWIKIEDLLAFTLNLWPGDPYFLPLVFSDNPRPFHGVMPYENGLPISWSFDWG